MVNEEIDEDNDYIGGLNIRDDQRYEALLQKRKERRAVRFVPIHITFV